MLFRLGAPSSGEGTINVTLDLQDNGVCVGGVPIHLEVARKPLVPWHPAGLAPPSSTRVTLGEPPSPPRAVLGSSQPARGTLPVDGFDGQPRRRVLRK